MALAVLSFIIGIYHPTKVSIEKWIARRRDGRRARDAYPAFRRFVTRFGEFIDTDAQHDLGKLVQTELRRDRITSRDELGMTRERVFQGFWHHLDKRVRRQNPQFEEFLDSVSEFNHLLSRYLLDTVDPAFDEMPRDVRSSLPADAKRELEAFRERLVGFVDEYQEFSNILRDSLETCSFNDAYLSRPKPLTRPDE